MKRPSDKRAVFGEYLNRRLLLPLALCGSLASCGGGQTSPSSSSPAPSLQPSLETTQSVVAVQDVSTAQSLPPPMSAETPVLQRIPPATTQAPPPRAPPRMQKAIDQQSVAEGSPESASTQRLKAASGVVPNGSDEPAPLPNMVRRTVVTGIQSPTGIVVSSDGVLLHTERHGGLFAKRPGRPTANVFVEGGSSALSVAVDPDFRSNRFVYVLLRSFLGGQATTRVSRLALDATVSKVVDRQDILVAITPVPSIEDRPLDSELGDSLRFGPDGYLYVGLGDLRWGASPQSPKLLAGKVLRIDRNGQAAPRNQAPNGFDPRVFAYGVQNPVAMAFLPDNETLLVAQTRGRNPDDVSRVKAGANGGWDPRCSTSGRQYCEKQLAASPDWQPLANWGHGLARDRLSALERLQQPMWRGWQNAFAMAFDRGQRIDFVKLDPRGQVTQSATVMQNMNVGFRAMAQGPDGLYVATSGKVSGDEIWRLSSQ